MKNSGKVAFCGILAALSVVVLFLAGVIPTVTIAFPALAGCFLIPVVAELGRGWGAGTYAVCALLSFFLAPDREAALIYVLFFGYYPVLMPVLEKPRSKILRWAAKLALFNIAAILETVLAIKVLGIPWEGIDSLGKAAPAVMLLLANVVFIAYDYVLKGLVAVYFQRLHGRVRQILKMK